MSTYDPTNLIYPGGNFALDALITELKSEIATPIVFKNGASASMSSTTFASLISESVPVELDEVCLFITSSTISCGTAGDVAAFIHYIDGVSQANDQLFYAATGSTSGSHGGVVAVSRLQDKATGTYTFDLQWRNTTAARTIYSSNQKLYVLRWKRR